MFFFCTLSRKFGFSLSQEHCLVQLPKGREVDDDDSFLFNEEFTAPLYRIKVYSVVYVPDIMATTNKAEMPYSPCPHMFVHFHYSGHLRKFSVLPSSFF